MKTVSLGNILVGVGLSFLLIAANAGGAMAASCESLASLSLPNATITSAATVEAGAFIPPGGGGNARRPDAYTKLPAFCRVQATLKPTDDSDIKIEVWLPISGWNGKLESVGNGGWAGNISYSALASALAAGFAAASTDTGHTGGSATFVVGHPEKLIDFGHRSIHELTVKAKAVVAAYYGSAAKRAYYAGCSTGGRQGLQAAQRYPADFDGIVVGAPANNWTNQQSAAMWVASATLIDKASYLGAEKFALLNKAALAACDVLDGVKDGVIDDPTRCRFDPGVLQCKGDATADCLSPSQVEAARKIYGPAVNPRSKQEYYPGFSPGSELGWNAKAGGPEPWGNGLDYLKYVVFQNPAWDWKTFDFDKDVAMAAKVDNNNINATDPNLRPFQAHGGKLLEYHGWADNLIAPQNSINYYKQVGQIMGGAAEVSNWYRLFLIPGMGHCSGGPGTDTFDAVAALDQWVEKGVAPESIPAAHLTNGKVDRTRPLCPYPQTAHYKGSGSTDDAANYVCK